MILKEPFYFLKDTETDYNLNSLCAGGKVDVPLNKTGTLQALSLRTKISSLVINKVVCSPFKRAIQTAALAIELHPTAPKSLLIDHDIKECNIGNFDGKPISELIKYMNLTQAHIPFPGGESMHNLSSRIKSAINNALLNYGGNILFVSHGLVYQSLLELVGLPAHHIPNTTLVSFKPEGRSWRILNL